MAAKKAPAKKKEVKSYKKDEFVALMAKYSDSNKDTKGLSKAVCSEAVDVFFKALEQVVSEGAKVPFVGYGTFEVSERAARDGRNPQTGEAMKIKASKALKFKAGKVLKDAVNSK